MKSDKTQKHISVNIYKHRILIIRGKKEIKHSKKTITYKILNEIKHKKKRFHREESNKQFNIQKKKRAQLKAKETCKEISKIKT